MPVEPRTISDNCELLRRINPIHIVPDSNTGRRRLSSGAFRDKNMSVDAECLLAESGLDWRSSTRGYGNQYLVRFSAGFARRQQQAVEHKPNDGNAFHTEVIGRKPQLICNAFRLEVHWVVAPPGI
jgi:hypothetical protein